MKIFLSSLVALVVAMAITTAALAGTGDVALEQGGSQEAFPAQSSPGDTFTISPCILQNGGEGAYATQVFGQLKAAGLTLVSATGGATIGGTANRPTVSFTNAAHSAKCYQVTFHVDAAQPYGTYQVPTSVTTWYDASHTHEVGHDADSYTLNLPAPTPPPTTPPATGGGTTVVTPPVLDTPVVQYIIPKSNVFTCTQGVFGNPMVVLADDVDVNGGVYWNPFAVLGATAGHNHAGNYNLFCTVPAGMKDAGITVDVNGQQVDNVYRQDAGEFTVVR